MPTEQEWEAIAEGMARVLNATCVAITECAGEALGNGPSVLGGIADWLEINGGAAALSTVRGVIDSALDGRRR